MLTAKIIEFESQFQIWILKGKCTWLAETENVCFYNRTQSKSKPSKLLESLPDDVSAWKKSQVPHAHLKFPGGRVWMTKKKKLKKIKFDTTQGEELLIRNNWKRAGPVSRRIHPVHNDTLKSPM